MTKQEAIEYFGNNLQLAKFVGVPGGNCHRWKRVPMQYQVMIEKHSGGKLVADKPKRVVRYVFCVDERYIEKTKEIASYYDITVVEAFRNMIDIQHKKIESKKEDS